MRNILRTALIAAVILVVLLFVSIALVIGSLGQSSFESSYSYGLTISTTGPIEDAVLLLPLPAYYDPDSKT